MADIVVEVVGDARVKVEDEDGYLHQAPSWELAQFHGLDDQTDFLEYFDADWRHKLRGSAFLEFRYERDGDTGILFAVTKYHCNEELSDTELAELARWTQGQWSDGIGEGFEQFPIERDGQDFYVSAWHLNQDLSVCQRVDDLVVDFFGVED